MTVELRVGSQALRGWTSVQVVAGIEQASRTFTFTITGPLADEQGLRVGQACSVWEGGDELVRGYLETVEASVAATSRTRSFGGRSKTCDAVDCSAAPGSRPGLRFADLVRAIVGDHDIDVSFDDEDAEGLIIPRHRVTLGETIFDEVDKLARERGFLVTDDGAGRLRVTKPAMGGKATTELVVGRNALTANGSWDMSRRYSEIEVRGQSFTDLEVDPAAVGGATDPSVTRTRKLIVRPEKPVGKEAALQRARWEAVTRAGQSTRSTFMVRGWRQDDGTLWQPNQLVRVTFDDAGFDRAELLITEVAYSLDEQGRKCALTLAPEAGFKPWLSPASIGASVGRWLDGAAAAREQRAGVLRR